MVLSATQLYQGYAGEKQQRAGPWRRVRFCVLCLSCWWRTAADTKWQCPRLYFRDFQTSIKTRINNKNNLKQTRAKIDWKSVLTEYFWQTVRGRKMAKMAHGRVSAIFKSDKNALNNNKIDPKSTETEVRVYFWLLSSKMLRAFITSIGIPFSSCLFTGWTQLYTATSVLTR